MRHDILAARSLKISYSVAGETRVLNLTDAKEVQSTLSTLEIERTEKGAQVGLRPRGRVDFVLADGTILRTAFVNQTQLDISRWGQVYLKNSKFYERACAVLSKKEGKSIDILGENP